MVQVEVSTEIARPVHDVFTYVEDERNMPAWDPDLIKATPTSDGATGVGSTFHLDIKPFMGETEGHGEVIGYEPDRTIEVQFHMGRMHPHVWHLFEATPRGTRFTRRLEMQPEGVMRLMSPLMKRMIRKHNEHNLATLKSLLEA